MTTEDSATPAALEIRLFGGLELVERGTMRKFAAPSKAASLLAYLIVHRERAVSREDVAFAFWPDDEEARARANLRRHLSLIVAALPDGGSEPAILADNRTLRWNPRYPCTVDVVEFERLSAQGDAAIAGAAAIYRGDLLPSAYDEWILPERERLRIVQGTNLESLTERYVSTGDLPRAIASARALCAHDPWREDALRTLLSLREAAGDRAGALAEYESFADRLRADLDVEPMPETRQRYESIARGVAAEHSGPPASALERATLPATMPFVGRDDEVARLRHLWERAMRGFGSVAMLSGEAGIGKSRLVVEFGAIVASEGGRAIAGAALFPESRPYDAVADALRAALPAVAALPLDPVWFAAASEVLPELRDGDGALPRLSVLEPEREADRLFESLWRCFEGLARERPLLLILEDLHWAGPATVKLLGYLARRARGHPMLIVVTCRDDGGEATDALRLLRQTLRRGGTFSHVPLDGITADQVHLVLSSLLAGDARSPAFAQRAHELCSGNPFFLAEIVRDCLVAPAGSSEPVLPRSLETSIGDRVARLSPDARSLAGIAAVVGRAFTVEIVAAVAGRSEGTAERGFDELLDVRLVHEAGATAATRGDDFVFTHELIRAQLYATLPATLRKRHHRRVAAVIETLRVGALDAMVGDLAYHCAQGGEPEKAASYYLASARFAANLYADEEALRAAARAAELSANPALRFDALALCEALHARAGRRGPQLAALAELEALAETLDDDEHRFECMRRRVLHARATDDRAGQARWIDALRARTAAAEGGYWQAFCSEQQASLMTSLGRHEAALFAAGQALTGYRQLDDAAGSVRALCLIADIRTLRAESVASQAALDEGTAIAVASSNEVSIVRTLAASALAAYVSVDFARAQQLAQRGLELARTIGDRESEADFLFRLGNIAGRRFSIADATSAYAQATAIYEELNKAHGIAVVQLNTALLYLKIGEHAEALVALRRARATFLEIDDLRGLTVCAINLGMAAYLRGQFGAALRVSRTALRLAQRLENPQLACAALGNVGAAERELGALGDALTHSEEALAQRRRMAPMDIGSDLADMAMTYLRAGNLPAALAIADEIDALPAGALDTVMFPQSVLWNAAAIYAEAGRAEPAARLARRAAELYDERLAKIPEGPWRTTYAGLAFNRPIVEAAAESDALRTGGAVR